MNDLSGLLEGGFEGASLLDRLMQPPAPTAPDLDLPPGTERERRGEALRRAMAAEAAQPWFEDWTARFERAVLDGLAKADPRQAADLAAQMRALSHMKQCFRQDMRTADRAKAQQQEGE